MTQDPFLLVLLTGAAVWIGRAWTIDYRATLAGKPNQRALPGAAPASAGVVAIGSLGALFYTVHFFELNPQRCFPASSRTAPRIWAL
jgi:hypothetical protein